MPAISTAPNGPSISHCCEVGKRFISAGKGARLFNLVPQGPMRLTGVSVDTFKAALDGWLAGITDQPTTPGRQRAALTNSLIDQAVMNH